MSDLREKVAEIVQDCEQRESAYETADAILDLPEIKEAFEALERESWRIGEKDPD